MRPAPSFVDALPLLFLLLIAAGALYGAWRARRRRAELRAWAEANGWQYRRHLAGLTRRWSGRPFNAGSSRRATDVLTGTFQGRPALAFRYQYTIGSGKNRRTEHFHVTSLALPAALPTLELTPENLGTRIGRVFGAQDIQFESEAFNRRWRVVGRHGSFAHAVVNPRLMERLLRSDAERMSIRIEGADVLAWSGADSWTSAGRRLSALASDLGVLAAVADAVPRFVWQENGYDPLTRPTEAP